MNKKGKAIIFSAPSGAGKTTIVKEIINRIPNLRFSISVTTRGKRPGEVHGKDYYFLNVEEFDRKKEEGKFLEWEEVYEGLYYGTLREEVERIWKEGQHVIFDVDVQGGLNLKKVFGANALAIFVNVDDPEILRERLKNRQTESDEMLTRRVDKALLEMKERSKFDEIVQNDDLDKAIRQSEYLITRFIS